MYDRLGLETISELEDEIKLLRILASAPRSRDLKRRDGMIRDAQKNSAGMVPQFHKLGNSALTTPQIFGKKIYALNRRIQRIKDAHGGVKFFRHVSTALHVWGVDGFEDFNVHDEDWEHVFIPLNEIDDTNSKHEKVFDLGGVSNFFFLDLFTSLSGAGISKISTKGMQKIAHLRKTQPKGALLRINIDGKPHNVVVLPDGQVIVASPERVTTLLGSYNHHLRGVLKNYPTAGGKLEDFKFPVMRKGDINMLNVSDDLYQQVQAAKKAGHGNAGFFQRFNSKWIDEAVARGDDIYLSKPLKGLVTKNDDVLQLTGFGKEVQRLQDLHGYGYNPVSGKMMPHGPGTIKIDLVAMLNVLK